MTMRFRFNWDKAIQAIDFIAQQKPDLTQYYIGKIMFFADREHFLDYGRPVSGDKYVAMEYGPVPSSIRNLLQFDSGFPDEILEELDKRIEITTVRNKLHVSSKGSADFSSLSGSDKEYLQAAVERYSKMSFGNLCDLSHEDPAYIEAWSKPGINNEMNIELWLEEFEDPELAVDQAKESIYCAV